MLEGLITRIWNDLISRPAGPLKFRFLLQPAMAVFLALRSGLKDSREGKPAFLWAVLVEPLHRRELLRDAWKSIGKLFLLAVVLDCAYQMVVFHWIYPGEAFVVSLFLAVIPYVLVRGPVNRIASLRKASMHKIAVQKTAERVENDYAMRR